MKLDINHLMGKPKMLHSEKAESAARKLLAKAETQDIYMEVMPSSFLQFTGDLEEQDYVSYCEFVTSLNGRRVLQMLEESDAEECIEL